LIYEYCSDGGHLASNLPSWINRYFSNLTIIVSGHYFSYRAVEIDFCSCIVFSLTLNNDIKLATHCSVVGFSIISRAKNIYQGKQIRNFQGNLFDFMPKIGYPVLAYFISEIYNPQQFSLDPYFPVPISNLLIVIGGYCFLEDFFGKQLHTYEFGYTGRLIKKTIKKHSHFMAFFIELKLLLNVYEFSTFFFVVGCLLLVLNLLQ